MLQKMRSFWVTKPVISMILIFVLSFFVVDSIVGVVATVGAIGLGIPEADRSYFLTLITRIGSSITLALVLALLFGKRSFAWGDWKDFLRWGAYYLLLGLGNMVYTIATEASGVTVWAFQLVPVIVAMCVFVGIYEEFLYRGLFLGLLVHNGKPTTAGLLQALIVSSVLFALIHVIFDVGQMTTLAGFVTGVAKAVQSGLVGFFLGALYLKTRSLWQVALLHALFDAFVAGPAAIMQTATQEVGNYLGAATIDAFLVVTVLVHLPLAYIGWRILKQVDPEKAKAGLPA